MTTALPHVSEASRRLSELPLFQLERARQALNQVRCVLSGSPSDFQLASDVAIAKDVLDDLIDVKREEVGR